MGENGVFVFPDALSKGANSSLDPNLLLALQQNGGFGNNGYWIWILFMWMMWGYNGNGNGFGNNNGTGFLANQLNNDAGRDLLLQAINGRADAISQLAQMLNTNIETVKNGIFTLQSSIQQVGSQVGITALQTQNSILLGNAGIAKQICECCCENRLAIANQTNAIQAGMAANHAAATLQAAQNQAATQLQMAQIESADQLAVCQQTNQLGSQADRNTNNILNAINTQNALIVKEFCDLKERELQNKIDTQGDIITHLRGQISNDKQTEAFNAAINALNEKIALLAAKQPNTVPVQYPNIVAANATPYVGYTPGYPQNNFWG